MPYTPELVPTEALGIPHAKESGGYKMWLPYAILAVLLAVLYHRVAMKLAYDWETITDYSHGPLVPLFSVFLIWEKRKALSNIPVKQTWAGVPLIIFSLIVLIVGTYGVELFTTRISFVMLLAGMVWTLLGGAMLRAVAFPLMILILAIPIPAIVFNQITFPLQLLASRIASEILPMLNVPTVHEGNIIELPIMKLEVAEACSGIRSLMSLFTLAVFYGYFIERTTARRVILVLASIPIAVTANVARIVGTGLCVQYWDPDKALGFFHLVHRAMRLIPSAEAKTS
jgi:exosortase